MEIRSSSLKCGTSMNCFRGCPLTKNRYPLGWLGRLSVFSRRKADSTILGMVGEKRTMPLECNPMAKFHMNS